MLKSIILLLLLFLLQLSTAKAESLTLGYFVLGPHIYVNEDGNAQGPLPEFLTEHIGPSMGVTFNLVNMPLARILKTMKEGQIAGAALFGYTPARAEDFSYPSNSYISMHPVITVLNQHPLTQIESVDDIANLSIGYVKGAIVSPFMKSNDIVFTDIYGSNTWERNIQRLLKGHIDVAYSPIYANMSYVASKMNLLDSIRIIRLPEAPMKLYSLFSKHKNFKHLALAKRYDRAFERINGKALYQKIYTRHYGSINSE